MWTAGSQAGVLAGALFGLFEMHGLGDHSAAPHETHAAAMVPTIAAADPAHGKHSSHTDASDQMPGPESADAPGPASPGMSPAGCCRRAKHVVIRACAAPTICCITGRRRPRGVNAPPGDSAAFQVLAFVCAPLGSRWRRPPS